MEVAKITVNQNKEVLGLRTHSAENNMVVGRINVWPYSE